MSDGGNLPPADWYPDPKYLSVDRWWTGEKWTMNTRLRIQSPLATKPSAVEPAAIPRQTASRRVQPYSKEPDNNSTTERLPKPILGAIGVLALVGSLLLPTAAASAAPKNDAAKSEVSLCHRSGNGQWRAISVGNERAAAAHLDNHGDALPGEPVPGEFGLEFGEDCKPVIVYARVYTDLNMNGAFDRSDVMISKLIEFNGDNAAGAGDKIVFGQYPTTLRSPFEFGTFRRGDVIVDRVDCWGGSFPVKQVVAEVGGLTSAERFTWNLGLGSKGAESFSDARRDGSTVIYSQIIDRLVVYGGSDEATYSSGSPSMPEDDLDLLVPPIHPPVGSDEPFLDLDLNCGDANTGSP